VASAPDIFSQVASAPGIFSQVASAPGIFFLERLWLQGAKKTQAPALDYWLSLAKHSFLSKVFFCPANY